MHKYLLWVVWGAVACSSDNETAKEVHAFIDSAGRSCQATLEKTSPGAPVVGEAVSCHGEGKQCSAHSTPCFQLSVDHETFQVRNCPACCKGSSSSFVDSECSAVSCQSNAECIYDAATCQDGLCVCPDGICE